jgi:hypothetical protein
VVPELKVVNTLQLLWVGHLEFFMAPGLIYFKIVMGKPSSLIQSLLALIIQE